MKLVSAEYDLKFIKYLDWVGKIHTTRGGSKRSRVDVEYIRKFRNDTSLVVTAVLLLLYITDISTSDNP